MLKRGINDSKTSKIAKEIREVGAAEQALAGLAHVEVDGLSRKQRRRQRAAAVRRVAVDANPVRGPASSRYGDVLAGLIEDESEELFAYARGVVDPFSCGTRLPDPTTLTPTGLFRFRETGTLTTDATGAALMMLAPLWGDTVCIGSGTFTWGAAGITGGCLRFSQSVSVNGLINGARLVGLRVTMEPISSALATTGQVATASWGSRAFAAYPSVAESSSNPTGNVQGLPKLKRCHGFWVGNSNVREGGLNPDELYIREAFYSPDTAVTGVAPAVLSLTVEGAPASAAVLQVTVDACFEATVNTNAVPLATPGSNEAAKEVVQLVSHPKVMSELHKPHEADKFLENAAKWVWGHKDDIAEGVQHSAGTMLKVAKAAAPYVASLAPLLL